MNFNKHSALAGKHAFLSPSQYHWINYNDQKMTSRWYAANQANRGTQLHDYAMRAIRLGIKQPKSKQTLYLYINDALSFKMTAEQPLYYSDNCFGTADSISFRNNRLRIHDLKTGISKASEHQLNVYAALFCLEYGVSPFDIEIETRIYQNDEYQAYFPTAETIMEIMDIIIYFDRHIELLKEGVDL